MKILYFFLFLWVIFALLDPDPETQINADQCGSMRIRIRNPGILQVFCTDSQFLFEPG